MVTQCIEKTQERVIYYTHISIYEAPAIQIVETAFDCKLKFDVNFIR